MSDPVTNAEVEDVLSSIRRLVSEDRRPLNRAKPEKSAEDKLVLTPSLRVSNDAPLIDAYKKQTEHPRPTEWKDTVEEGDALRGSDHVITPSEKPARPLHATPPADISDTRFQDDDAFDDEDGFQGEGAFDDDEDFAGKVAFDDDDALDDQDAYAAVDHFDLTGDDLSDATTADLPSTDPVEPVWRQAAAADTAGRSAGHRSDILSLGASELVEDVAPMPDRLSAKIAALESAISRIPENWEPDVPGEGDYSGSDAPAMAWEDDVELDNTGAPLNPSDLSPSDETIEAELAAANAASQFEDEDAFDEDEQQDTTPNNGFGADEYFDEEMLRDLVSEIVRSELQGALGERITRNVRKLVRREIHRALTAQDLE